jgi:hypothetical protein
MTASIITERVSTAALAPGDTIVTGAGVDLCFDSVIEVGEREPAAMDGCVVVRIDAVRRWPNDPSRVQGQGVFYWVGSKAVHDTLPTYLNAYGIAGVV